MIVASIMGTCALSQILPPPDSVKSSLRWPPYEKPCLRNTQARCTQIPYPQKLEEIAD